MKEQDIDRLIEEGLKGPAAQERTAVDVGPETMARIEAFEGQKARWKYYLQWAVSLFTAAASLVSLYLFEIFFSRYRLFFQISHLDISTLKSLFQGFFAVILLASLIIMIGTRKSRRRLYHLLF